MIEAEFRRKSHPFPRSRQRILNKSVPWAVFMIEGRRVVAGEAILNGVTTTDRSNSDFTPVAGTDKILELLVRDHSRLVYRISYAVLRRHHDAEDATQETFLRVLRYQEKLAAVNDPKTWLARIAWRVAVDRSRRRGSTGEVALDDSEKRLPELASNDAAADEQLQSRQANALLEKMITALPRKLREPLVLSTVEEMTPREVAATLGINEAAVRSRIFRARQILKEKLAASSKSR
jgi:RNA polymerase sigma-70 factor (ECF subfamily)